MGQLYIVGTPIGNLDDISVRAVETLRSADLIAAEDTRHSGKLLRHFAIETPMISYHEHSRESRLDELIRRLDVESIALISDAGMPAVSDPGADLVDAALNAGHEVVVVPGPSSVTAAVALSGLVRNDFYFAGFLPRKAGALRDAVARLAAFDCPIVFFESPHRLGQTLEAMRSIMGQRRVALARELTKMYEEIWRGTFDELMTRLETEPVRGEYVVVIGPPESVDSGDDEFDLDRLILNELNHGASMRDVVRRIVDMTGLPRRKVYDRALSLRK